ncbi:hypothetical protein GCM10027399_09380 [Curvibacter fontanus]
MTRLLIAFALLLLAGNPALAAPAAGSVIDNRATVRYVDGATGMSSELQSNTVRVVVQPLEAGTLVPNLTRTRPAGADVSLPHRLTNSGNAAAAFDLAVANLAGDDFDLLNLRLFRDLNGNGLADPGEPAVDSVALAAGEAADLVAVGQVPSGVAAGAAARLQITGISRSQGALARATDMVQVSDAALVALNLSASTLQPAWGETVVLRLAATNPGRGTATGIPFTADGAAMNRLLLSLPLPVNTTYTAASLAGASAGTLLLYHLAGTPAGAYTRTPPADLGRVDAVAYALDALPAGSSTAFELSVRVNANASGLLPATAQASYGDGSSATVTAASNTVTLALAARMPTLRHYADAGFGAASTATTLGAPLYLQADAATCNTNAAMAETVLITLGSRMAGDAETFTGVETGPNTGMFRIAQAVGTASAMQTPAVSGNGMVEAHPDDMLTAALWGCSAEAAWTNILVDPAGVVFDSRSNQPLAGATVTLIDVTGAGNGGNPGGSARVFAADGTTPAPSTVVTAADGRYHFPLVAPSTYRLAVTPPGDYRFPSQLPPAVQPAGRTIDPSASYGGTFTITAASGAVTVDLPLDPAPAGALLARKSVSRTVAEIGDFVDYTVEVKNVSGGPLDGVVLNDRLPAGFAYQPGSTRRDGRLVADPAGGRGPLLAFPLGVLADGASAKISYRLVIGPGASPGDAVNSAQAVSAAPLSRRSNLAQAVVRVEGGVFDDKGFVLGKVFADCDGNGVQDPGEPGVPGVRVWLEDGTWAIADGLGKFSFAGITPRTHVAKLDPATLPAGARPLAIAQRHANDGGSRFVDLKNGELHRADFALACTPPVLAEIERRRAAAARGKGEVEAGIARPLSLDGKAAAGPVVASGVIGGDAPSSAPVPPAGPTAPAPAPVRPLADLLPTLDNSPDFIGLADGAILPGTQTTLRVKGPAGAPLALSVNDQPVPESRIGTRLTVPDRQLEAREYVGVDLAPGDNRLVFEQRDGFGNLRGQKALTVRVPGELARLRLEALSASAPADGGATVRVTLRLEDAQGLPVAARTPVTLETTAGRWQVADLDPKTPGVQVFVEGGQGEFALVSPSEAGEARLRAESGRLRAEAAITFLPALRELVAVGLVEGVLNLKKLSSGALQPVRQSDAFERELTHFARGDGAARAALFLKGRIRGDTLLTLAYDSDKDTRERLFRDLQPDRYYPVYGDASVKGFDAQSTQKFYVRLDRGKSWLLYGDFATSAAAASPARQLSAYNRNLSGLKTHTEEGPVTVDAFVSRDSTRQVVEEIPANGTSGPYALKLANLIVNSERVEIVTRDRNQPAVVIKTVPQTRFADYELEAFSGRILFRAPVASVDADLNNQFVRVTYEVEQGGESFWVMGMDTRVKVNEVVEIGAVAVEDRNPQDPATLRGASATVKLGATTVVGEAARSEKLSGGSGNAARLEIKHEDGDLSARIWAGRADAGFENPSATLTRGRSEGGAKVALKVEEGTRLVAETLHSGDLATGSRRDGVLVGAERMLDHNLKLEAGVRRSQETVAQPAPGAGATTSLRVKLGAPLPDLPQATVYAEAEQATGDSDKKLLAVGGDYRLSDRSRIYGRHEFISSLSGPWGLDASQRRNTTVLGVDSEIARSDSSETRSFSEYRARDAFTGREAEAAMGLKNRWQAAPGLRIDAGAERISALAGSKGSDATALTGAVELTRSPDWKATARQEWRTSPSADSWLSTLGLAWKIDREWIFLGRNIYSLNRNHDGGERLQDRLQLGVAYREADTNRWNGLARYEFKAEKDDALDTRRQVHIVSAHANVQPTRVLVLTGRYAGKLVLEDSGGLAGRSTAHLVSGRSTYDLGSRWDVGVQASALFSAGAASSRTALGAEVGYRLEDNLWLSVGYNVFGFQDRDLAGEDSTERGIYLRLRFKFDEKLFERL